MPARLAPACPTAVAPPPAASPARLDIDLGRCAADGVGQPPLLDGPRPARQAARVQVQVGLDLRGPLVGALLALGMQPVLGAAKTAGLALEIRAFGPDTGLPAPGRRPDSPPLLALLPGATGRANPDWRRQALQAGALSLITLEHGPSDCLAIAQLAARLTQHTAAPPAPAPPAPPHARPNGLEDPVPVEPAAPLQRPANAPELFAAIDEAVAHACRAGAVGALLLIGINRLAEIDTALGSAACRQVIDTAETRLADALRRDGNRHRLRTGAELYRHEGGFAVLWPQLSHGAQAGQMADLLLGALTAPLTVDREELGISANAGIALLPHDGLLADGLIEAAKRALHHARSRGPGTHQFHAQDIAPRTRDRLRLETRLRHAVAEGRFEIHYQPQVDLRTGALTGAEALLRWPDAAAGAVAPAVFIPLAEATGLIVPLGHWVLQRVCRQIRRWLDRGLEVPRISVNVSPLQLRQPDFVARVLGALAEAGLSGRHLGIELTEAALATDHTHNAATDGAALRERLQILREAGVQLSIDDFGTGSSSLAALRRLPVDGLKIDRSFVADISGDGAAICTAIIGLAHALGLRVVAEGIETDAQLNFLRELDCDEFQGHVLAPALGATIMGEVLAGATIQHRVQPAPPLQTAPAIEPQLLRGRTRPSRSPASPPIASRWTQPHISVSELSQLF